jgi:hypothetical protein
MQTFQSPVPLSNIFGAAQIGDPDPEVIEFTPAKGVVPRGAVVAIVAGKGELVTAASQANAFGVALEDVDTDSPPNTGAVARRGSFKATQLTIGSDVTDLTGLEKVLRDAGVFLEGNLVVLAP